MKIDKYPLKIYIVITLLVSIGLFLSSHKILKAQEPINIAVFESCPYVCTDHDKKGVLIDILEAIFRKNGLKANFFIQPQKDAIKQAKQGKYDGVLGVTLRQAPELIIPEESIGLQQYVLYTKENDSWIYTGLNSIKKVRIGIQKGQSYGIANKFIKRQSQESKKIFTFGGKNIINQKLKSLAKNKIDVFIEDKNKLDHFISTNISIPLKVAGNLPPDNLYIAYNHFKGTRLSDITSTGIKNLRASGKLKTILRKYGLEDWQDWNLEENLNPFADNYAEHLKESYALNLSPNLNHKKITFKSSVSKGSAYWLYAEKFKELLHQYSKNKIKVVLDFGNETEHDIVLDIANNKTHMGIVAINNYSPYAPSSGFLTLPYMFPTIESAKTLFRSSFIKDVKNISALESNVRPLSFFIGGYRKLANSKKEVETIEDLKGLKIRTPNNQIMIETFRSWGIEPYPIHWPNVYPSLKNGTIDGQENPMNIILSAPEGSFDIFAHLKYVTDIRYFLFSAPHLMSESLYQSLTIEERSLIQRTAREAEEYMWRLMDDREAKSIEYAISKGVTFTKPKHEEETWKKQAQKIWPKFYFRTGGKKLIDKAQNIINKNTPE